ncbi:hypothetical protein [Aneurinibacillus thermoaerophilus]|uniref:hypothetical protein n=1 Tax=Aneurinibacillus thermoaerophilus TaxID=143495 RepID=UPI002E2198F7|nr:hypothetical protein [Aneurinibacillus thermoaerophilus]
MKKIALLVVLASIFIFAGCSQKESESASIQKETKPTNEVLQNETEFKYSVEEIKNKLSNPSSHYENSVKFPDVKADKWESDKNSQGDTVYHSYVEKTKQAFGITVSKDGKITDVIVSAHIPNNSTEKTFENVIAAAEIISSATGLQGDEVKKKIYKLFQAQNDIDMVEHDGFMLVKRMLKDKRMLMFSVSLQNRK